VLLQHTIVGVDAFRPHDMGLDCLNNGIERHHAGANPICQGRDIDLNAFAGIGLVDFGELAVDDSWLDQL
jgi:hypothetical protein